MAKLSYDDACCYPHLDSAMRLLSSLFPRLSAEVPQGPRSTRAGDQALPSKRPGGMKQVASVVSMASTTCSSEGDASRGGDHSESEEEEDLRGQVRQADLDRAFQEIGVMRRWDKALWEVEEILGAACGGHGSVARMRRVPKPEVAEGDGSVDAAASLVAVKSVPRRWLATSPAEFRRVHGPAAIELPWQDICITRHLNTMNYPYACELVGIFVGDGRAHVVTSLATQGDLFAWSAGNAHRPGASREASMRPLLGQVFEAVRWLHDWGIAHRDLSLENILLTDSQSATPQVRIIDFGMATLQPRRSWGVRGKLSYQAPEMHKSHPYDAFAADAFALGVVLFGMACAKYPWKSTKPGACPAFELLKVRGFEAFLTARAKSCEENGQRLLTEVLSGPCQSLMKGLLTLCPHERTTVGEVCFKGALNLTDRRRSVWDSEWLKQEQVCAEGASRARADGWSVV